MRSVSIISIIRKFGLNSKKLSSNYRIKFRATLEDLSAYSNDDLELTGVVDNHTDPQLSVSDTCMVEGCGKHIRFEYHLLDKKTGTVISCGSSCCSSLLGLSKLQQKSFKNIETIMKEKAELEGWRKENPHTVKKLMKLAEYDLPFYRPFIEEAEVCALTPEDTDFINRVNLKLVLTDLKMLDIIDELLKYEENVAMIRTLKSIRDHSLVQGKYFSRKQKEFIASKYETLLEERKYVTLSITGGYEFRETLKTSGYKYFGAEKTWKKKIERVRFDEELKKLKAAGISESHIFQNK